MKRWILSALLVLSACQRGGGAEGAPRGGPGAKRSLEYPVEVAEVESRKVEYQVSAVGSVEAFETVQVTARVAGVVERVYFTEGDQVKEGAKLVDIEPRRYQIAVASAKAGLQRAAAQLAEAEAALKRREDANQKSPGLVKAEELEASRTRMQAAAAAEGEAKAALNLAELNLRDALVRAPIAGTIESRQARTGQYVQPGTLLATLVRRDPLLLRFSVPESEASELHPGRTARFTVRGLSGEHEAKISHVSQAADAASRMVPITAHIEKPAPGLRPGSFAEVRVPIGASVDAPVIPQTAVRPSELGFLAFVIEEGVAKRRVLKLGLRTGDGMVEVRSGLEPGERLVIRGAEALREGAKVRVVEGDGAPPPAEARAGGADQ